MLVTKQTMPAFISEALPVLVADIVEYLELEENDKFSVDDLSLDGYYTAGSAIAFLVYNYESDDELAFAAIKLNPNSRSFLEAAVFSWERGEGQSTEQALNVFLEMNPHV